MTMHQLFAYYLPITVTLFVTMLSSYLVAALVALLSKRTVTEHPGVAAPFRKPGRAERILHASDLKWRLIRVAGALLGLGLSLWAYPAAWDLVRSALHSWL